MTSTPYTNASAIAFFQAFPVIFPSTLHTSDVLAIMNDTTGTIPGVSALFGNGAGQIASDLVPADPIPGAAFNGLCDGAESAGFDTQVNGNLTRYVSAGQVNIGDPNVQTFINSALPAGSYPKTNAAMMAAATRRGSPAECLWGQFNSDGTYSFTLTADDVNALGMFSG